MRMKSDNIHYSFNSLDGYNKPINFVISPRGDGKTTAFLVGKAWKAFSDHGASTIVQRRFITDINEKYIDSLAGVINKFTDANLKLSYKMSQLKKDGVIDVYASSHGGKRIFTIIAMNTRLSNLKGLFQNNTDFWFCDEFVCNPQMDERYLKGEAFKFKEAFNTLARENFKIKAYFLGNPYSLYNPYFQAFGINPASVAVNRFVAGNKWVVEYHRLTPELREYYLANNPMYDEGDTYTMYALEGTAILDRNINIVPSCPQGFELFLSFRQNEKNYGIYRGFDLDIFYWVGEIESISKNRHILVFDFDDLEDGSAIISRYEKEQLCGFASAMRKRNVGFSNIVSAYACQELYSLL